jgi:hypothetical protein
MKHSKPLLNYSLYFTISYRLRAWLTLQPTSPPAYPPTFVILSARSKDYLRKIRLRGPFLYMTEAQSIHMPFIGQQVITSQSHGLPTEVFG